MVYAHFYNWKTTQFEVQNSHSKALILPQFSTRLEFNRSERVNITYSLNARFPAIEQLASNFVLSSFNNVHKGNPSLENQLYHSLNLSYTKFSLIRNLNLNLHSFLDKKVEHYKNTTQLQGIDQYNTPVMYDLPEYNWRMMGTASKTIRKIRYKLNGNFNYANFYQTLNEDTQRSISKSFRTTVSAETLSTNTRILNLGIARTLIVIDPSIKSMILRMIDSQFI